MRDRRALDGADDLAGAEREGPARLEVDARAAAGTERPEADLRPLQVLEDRDRPAPAGLAVADAADDLGVLVVGAVREVEPRHVEPGRHEAVELLGAAARRTDRADDLGPSHRSGARDQRSQELSGIRAFGAPRELLGRPGGDHAAAFLPALGSEIDHP